MWHVCILYQKYLTHCTNSVAARKSTIDSLPVVEFIIDAIYTAILSIRSTFNFECSIDSIDAIAAECC